MKSIATKLGLDPEARTEAILDELTKLQNRADSAEKQAAALATERDQIKNRSTGLEAELCEALLDACGLKADDRRRPHLLGGLKPLANREARLTHLADFGLKPEGRGQKSEAGNIRILNRAEGGGANVPAGVDPNDEQALVAKATRIKNRTNELLASGTSFERAWNLATTEINTQH